MSKSCEVEIKFIGWRLEDVILKLAEYIEDGFQVQSISHSCSHSLCGGMEVTVALNKYK